MSWEVGFDERWNRDVGYGVPSVCDHPDCDEEIDRGLAYVCGGEPYGGDHGCGLFFCEEHRAFASDRDASLCDRCANDLDHYAPKEDTMEWAEWKLEDESWREWREQNPNTVREMLEREAKHMRGKS